MPWDDDSWKDSYDAWKLASPDDEYPDECEHDETELDVCTGRMECQICGHRWWATKDEVDAECERIASYEIWARQEHRREKLNEWWRWIVGLVKKSPEVDDEIPF